MLERQTEQSGRCGNDRERKNRQGPQKENGGVHPATLKTSFQRLDIRSEGMREFLRSSGVRLTLAVLLLPAAYIVSALASLDGSVAWTGYAIEWDTVIFASLAAAAFILSSMFFRTQRTARLLYTSLFWAIAAAALFQCVAIIFGPSLPGGTFADRSVNLVGKWNDLGLLASILGLFILVGFFFLKPYYDYRVYTVYDYLGIRFGPMSKNFVSALFLFMRTLASGTRRFVP